MCTEPKQDGPAEPERIPIDGPADPAALRQHLLDQLGETLGNLFAQGVECLQPVARRSVIDGLAAWRIEITDAIELAPLHVVFAVQRGQEVVPMIEIVGESGKQLRLTELMPQQSSRAN
jgi:hypothetical protein